MKELFTALALMLLSVSIGAGQNYPDPCNGVLSGTYKNSPLCYGLIEKFSFEENSNSPRFGARMSMLLEPQGANVGRTTALIANDGSFALSLNGTSDYLWQLGGLPTGSSTIAFWFKPTSLPTSVG